MTGQCYLAKQCHIHNDLEGTHSILTAKPSLL